ncbi:hypothetical protein [Saccharopolyspora phatthalungensis]|uniref:Uncharacterized protein n=1 Tax=Saccharopolyspora phatthalungensis TaxID=664693 RepID=A0A840Q1T5_9PSEU|nr:hypothetical protein [Saccharopolyspora phatthalungensis]MBB5153511.1 hypothetical protein [Saccharopolyspora phatthalungensis]
MSQLAQPGSPYKVVVVARRRWWACPIGGVRCCRVLVDMGQVALDAMALHIELHGVAVPCQICGSCHEAH